MGLLSDFKGRRIKAMLGCFLLAVAAALGASASGVWMLAVDRVMVGISRPRFSQHLCIKVRACNFAGVLCLNLTKSQSPGSVLGYLLPFC